MKYVELGKTGLKVSVAGLGTGGYSKLGQMQGESIEHSVGIVQAALDLGINTIDVSDTAVDASNPISIETIVGRAIKGRRDGLVISTKLHPRHEDDSVISAQDLRTYVEGALGRLNVDVIDIFYLHGLDMERYDYAVKELVPEMQRLRERGLIRFIGATESFGRRADSEHKMLAQAVKDDHWEVLMTGFNLLNHCAKRNVFPLAMAKGIGIYVMYAVRDMLAKPDLLREWIKGAVDQGLLDPKGIDMNDPLGFLVHEGGATSVVDAAYRFACYTPGVNTVLMGTGKHEHLRANVESINRGPLPREDVERLSRLFGQLTNFTGNAAHRYEEGRRRKKSLGM